MTGPQPHRTKFANVWTVRKTFEEIICEMDYNQTFIKKLTEQDNFTKGCCATTAITYQLPDYK